MKTLYSIYVISVVALLTAIFAIMSHNLRHRYASMVPVRATRKPRFPFNTQSAVR
jgi:hypothetical protein